MNPMESAQRNAASQYDVVVIGGGFGGCYMLWKLRSLGFSVHLLEAGSTFGGVWHWNSYPGCRVDSEMPYYQFSIPEVWKTWSWSERFPGHEELKRYFQHVDNVLGLSKYATFSTRVTGADFNSSTARWELVTDTGLKATCKWLIPATGNSSAAYTPDFEGLDSFKGVIAQGSSWPRAGIDFQGKNVGLIGAGATGVQLSQEISKQARELTVYVRNPATALPMRQRPFSILENNSQKAIYRGLFRLALESVVGIACDPQTQAFDDATEEERQELWEELWARGGFHFQLGNYTDLLMNINANKEIYEFWRKKVSARIQDPAKRAILAPEEPPYPFATKRSPLEQDYYDCLDQPHVNVVDAKAAPISSFTARGIVTSDGEERLHDVVVLATGYDNLTGNLTRMGLRGKDGIDLKERWKEGVSTYLGILAGGSPNMFMIFGPQAPTAFANAPLFIEMQGDIVADLLVKLRDNNVETIEPKPAAERTWKQVVQGINDVTLFHLSESSWYMGANIPGKKVEQLNYLGGIVPYQAACRDALKDWSDFDVQFAKDK
ncbi:hypothetical protein F5Y18DRAFT_322388 [Xylariaceae sp. FL1019]|nr:hypothetical protein F5Y18DRAFT_322388 [Xylariaceae sp. FL1019]